MVPNEIHGVMLTAPSICPKIQMEKEVETMIEEFEVNNIYIGRQPVMSLFSTGRTTGLTIDSGYERSDATPIFEGFSIQSAI